MGVTDAVLLGLELIGTFAFAVSGAIAAINKRLDIFGVLVLGVITSVGGGMIRDITLGVIPPMLFRKPIYVGVAAATSIFVFFVFYFRADLVDKINRGVFPVLLGWMDSVGLGVFTVVGVSAAVHNGYSENAFLAVTVGVFTGVGGGIIRDLLANRTPVVLHKQVYAVASIIGAITAWLLVGRMHETAALGIGAIVVVAIRAFAAHFKWDLPVVGNRE